MTAQEKELILQKFKEWFKTRLIRNHRKNTLKLKKIEKLNINPFLLYYLSNYLRGNSDPKSLAEALIYPRVLGTSITTSYGQNMQNFVVKILGAYGSTTAGIDIEFEDQIDGRRKYCQLKSGPNAINRDDVTTIDNKFRAIRNLARTNGLQLQYGDLVFALTYGARSEMNSFINELAAKNITVFDGEEFWYHFTGDSTFYKQLILASGEVAREIDMKELVDEVVEELSQKVNERFSSLFD